MIRRSMLTVALLATAHAVHAQLPIPSFAVVGGVSSFDLSGTGTAPIGALRVDVPLLVILAEGSLGVMSANQDTGRRTYVIPEAQLQYQILPIFVRPYLGVGAGWFKALNGPDPHPSELTLSASAGVRFSIPLMPVGLRAEARVRGIGSRFSGSATELTVGVSF